MISVEEQLNNLSHQDKITSGDVRNLKKEGSNMFRFYYEKKSQKSVLHFMAVRNANVFGPISMTILEPVELRTNLRKLLTHIVSLKTVSATLAERVLPQYLDLLIALTQHGSEKKRIS